MRKFITAIVIFISLIAIPYTAFAETAQDWFAQGKQSYSSGNYKRAIIDFDRAIKLSRNYADAYIGRGLAYGRLGDYHQAIEDFDRGIKIDPK